MAQVGASDITVNDVVAFLVELAAILALSAWGFRAASGLVPKVIAPTRQDEPEWGDHRRHVHPLNSARPRRRNPCPGKAL